MDAPLLLGIEIGGTKLQLGLGRGDGVLIDLERRRIDPGRGAAGILDQIEDAAGALLARRDARAGDLGAVGIGFGGPVDADRGVVTRSHQVEGWADFPIADWARRALGVSRVALGNDADAAALGEARFGAGVGRDPVFYMTIGSGIGGGLAIDGAIYRGHGLGAMEVGHLLIQDDPPKTLEQVASGWSIAREAGRALAAALAGGLDPSGSPLARSLGGEPSAVTAELVAGAAAEGDPIALGVLATAHAAVGRALAHVVTLLAPRRIILGGGVALIGERHWLGPIRRETDRRAFPAFRGTYDIVPASLGEAVVVHGALALADDARRDAPPARHAGR